MTEHIASLTTYQTELNTRVTTLTTQREATSDRSEIIRLGVEIKMANAEISSIKDNITQMNKDLAERNTEYKARLEQQAFEDQINALYQEGDSYRLAESGVYYDIDKKWQEYDKTDEFDFQARDDIQGQIDFLHTQAEGLR